MNTNSKSGRKKHPALMIGLLITIAVFVLASVAAIFFFSGNTETIQWSMQGYCMAPDGTVGDTFTLTVTGKIQNRKDGSAEMALDIDLPEEFRYQIQAEKFYCQSKTIEAFSLYTGTNFCYDKESDHDEVVVVALDVNAGYAMFFWPDNPDQILFASISGETAPTEISGHFQEYLALFDYKD